ncbi:hypothetical protein OR60_07620 [Xanthomonas vesicatoria]|nr:hypothetical protein OR60_07620 [Xanthomonas vesicatoria]
MELEVDAFERLRGVSADKLGLTGVRIGDVGGATSTTGGVSACDKAREEGPVACGVLISMDGFLDGGMSSSKQLARVIIRTSVPGPYSAVRSAALREEQTATRQRQLVTAWHVAGRHLRMVECARAASAAVGTAPSLWICNERHGF